MEVALLEFMIYTQKIETDTDIAIVEKTETDIDF